MRRPESSFRRRRMSLSVHPTVGPHASSRREAGPIIVATRKGCQGKNECHGISLERSEPPDAHGVEDALRDRGLRQPRFGIGGCTLHVSSACRARKCRRGHAGIRGASAGPLRRRPMESGFHVVPPSATLLPSSTYVDEGNRVTVPMATDRRPWVARISARCGASSSS